MPARRTVSDKAAKIVARGRLSQIAAHISGLRLVIFCNYPIDYKARPQQAGRQIEAKRNRRNFDKNHDPQAGKWTPEEARAAYIERALHAGVWDRVGEAI